MDNMNNNMYGANAPQFGYGQQPQITPVNCDQLMHITTVSDLQSYAAGTVVRFPDFAEGQPFVARVRRPSLLVLAKQGKIPNSLLTTAGELFSKGGGGLDADNENMLGDMYGIMEIIATAALIQPTMDEIKGVGLELSDDQLMAIFNYAQAGVKALESFRQE
jgi:hypothetical protein